MAKGNFKWHERRIARLLGGRRIPNSGFGQPDVIAGMFAVQCKHRVSLPKWFTDAWKQAKRDAKEGQVPVLVVSLSTQGRKAEDFVIVDLATFRDLHGELEVDDGAGELPG